MRQAVCGILHRGGHVLMGLRTGHEDFYPGCWDLIGGHLDFGESPKAALHRERGRRPASRRCGPPHGPDPGVRSFRGLCLGLACVRGDAMVG